MTTAACRMVSPSPAATGGGVRVPVCTATPMGFVAEAKHEGRPMDDIDRKLLALLQEDATTPMAELADKVGLSATPVWKRIQKLDQMGVIRARVALVEPELVGIGLVVFVAIEAHEHTPEWMQAFGTAVATMPEIMDAYRMAGEVDYMLRVAVPGMAAFDAFYKRLTAAVRLKNVTSRFAMERLKHTTAYPLPAHAFRDRRATGAEPN